MRIKLVSHLKGDEVLAEPVLTEEKEVLIPKGTRLKLEYKELILSLGVDVVSIEDPYEKDEVPHLLLSNEKRINYIQKVKSILESHIYSGKDSLIGLDTISESMVNDIALLEKGQVLDYFERSTDLYDHTVMVTLLAIVVARECNLSKKQQKEIALGALLHDLGIRYVTVKYLNRSEDERSAPELFEYKKHTILGFSAIEKENWIPENSKKIILSHHEKMDGSGFPLKQKNSEIECKILQVCDRLDCMISGMECKRVSLQEALDELEEQKGIWYDEQVVTIVEKLIARYPIGTGLELDDRDYGIVTSQTSNSIHPIIMFTERQEQEQSSMLNLEEDQNHFVSQIM